jgi:hypothetical protein
MRAGVAVRPVRALGASGAGATHVMALGPIGRREEFPDCQGEAGELSQEFHDPVSLSRRMSLPIAQSIATQR